jgi:hypothetical protein
MRYRILVVMFFVASTCRVMAYDDGDTIMSAPTPGAAPRPIENPGLPVDKPGTNALATELPDRAADAAMARELAAKYGVPRYKIDDMRQKTMSWREIDNALQIARHIVNTAKSPTTMEQALRRVVDLHAQGMSLDQIAQHFSAKLAAAVRERKSHTAMPSSVRTQADRPEVPARPEQPDKPDTPERPATPGI